MPRNRYYKNYYVSIAERLKRDNDKRIAMIERQRFIDEKESQERMSQEDSRLSNLGIHGLTKYQDLSK